MNTATQQTPTEQLRHLAWQKGWELFQSVRHGRRYLLRPAWCAIFAREQYTYTYSLLSEAARHLPELADPIAIRWDYDLWKWQQKRKAAFPAAPTLQLEHGISTHAAA